MADDPQPFDDDIARFRQPMATSIGIIMGFLLAFLANWAVADDAGPALQAPADWLVAGTILLSIGMLVIVLARLLDNRLRETSKGMRYQATFRLYIAAILVGLGGLTAALVV